GPLERVARARPSPSDVFPELSRARYLLERPADPAEFVRQRRPRSVLAPARVPGSHRAHAVLDVPARGVHHLSARVTGVLGEHLLDRPSAVFELDLRDAQGPP